jgi:hypothetical protein
VSKQNSQFRNKERNTNNESSMARSRGISLKNNGYGSNRTFTNEENIEKESFKEYSENHKK